MAKIEKLWFDSERIWITTDKGQTLSRPLEAYPTFKGSYRASTIIFQDWSFR